jgi:hypothetical protein
MSMVDRPLGSHSHAGTDVLAHPCSVVLGSSAQLYCTIIILIMIIINTAVVGIYMHPVAYRSETQSSALTLWWGVLTWHFMDRSATNISRFGDGGRRSMPDVQCTQWSNHSSAVLSVLLLLRVFLFI